MDDESEKLAQNIILWGAVIGVGYFAVLKPILDKLGVNSDDKNKVDDENTLDPSDSPFSYQFSQSMYSISPNIYGASYWQGLAGTDNQFATWGEKIYHAWDWFSTVNDEVNEVFNEVVAQSDVANIACYLFFNYEKDLLSYLQTGNSYIPWLTGALSDGLNASVLAAIINKVNSLPVSNYPTSGSW